MNAYRIILFLFIINTSGVSIAQEKSLSKNEILLLTGQGTPTLYGQGYDLIKEAADAYIKMKVAAAKDGFELKVVSSYRSFDRQLAIWNRKFEINSKEGMDPLENIKKITEYSTIPGTSRHHWGTEIDLISAQPKVDGDVLLANLFEGEGPYAALKSWMDANANSYGFFLAYPKDSLRKGFQYEPWHYSYKPKSKYFLKNYLTIDLKNIFLSHEILGKEIFDEKFIQEYKEDYILGISSKIRG
ncbi:MAG: M15 family metallopeptidase [Flavobacteriales bacterium]|jgi:LAS superfamily LD-carboxypeptidase LdcB|nr:M15 family metallopeptidase [Flavobacteriaceae bacterium]MDO7582428.1 M15 family metallopeptidase [Flavobacteriaceae bacterium]MDO7591185.1 M15 family metallopeptidase [Flavobacteriaceae bacterium]MDO7598750.1 M15 family metallopeptidase [Flavobacteriaceae bacterium]MDO7602664.1 M15 family metallopeptidase [Flavobacteriaceae bacterium]|tara:strand:- start:129 stop:857 length:729 start_codon:yes stop_codon:yes gene_type:complete